MKKIIFLSVWALCTICMAYGQWTYDNLSEPKAYMGATLLGSKAYFAGGFNSSTMLSTVEIYDFTTGEWDISNNLSVARELPFAVACGSKVLFAGGADFYGSGAVYSTVDIFDTIDQSWTVEQLSVSRLQAAVVSHGNKVLFAGGANLQQGVVYDIVDIYDIESGDWTTAALSEPRVVWWATVGDLAIFAGGYDLQTASKRVDIYNFTTDTWSIDSLSVARAFLTLTTIGSRVMIAGGMTAANVRSDIVDIFDAATGTWDTAYLSFPRAFCDNQNAVTICGKAFFIGGGNINLNGAYWTDSYNIIDIYDEATNSWSVDNLAHSPIHHAVVGYEDKFIVAGGIISSGYQSTVEIYTCPSSSCLPEGINFTTQQEIDNFQTNYPGCTEIEGSLTINGEDITNLNGLSVITSIGIDLNIGGYNWPSYFSNPHLTSLTGLDNLASVGGNLNISYDTALISLAGLESLTSIGGGLLIEKNYNLTNISGLENLAYIGSNLLINDNGSLTSLGGLENITSILGDLYISQTPLTNLNGIGNVTSISGGCYIGGVLNSLSGLENLISIGGSLSISGNGLNSLTGLNNLTSIGGDLDINQNGFLTSLSGLDNLITIGNDLFIWGSYFLTSLTGMESVTTVGGGVIIQNNPSLTNLSGLEGLTSIGGYLSIYDNDVLTTITGLESLTSIGELWIMDNNFLATCEAEWLCNYLSNPTGSINIYNNADGCRNPPEVADVCGITLNCLPYGNYYFHSQADIDDFQSDYPDCTELGGNVHISANDITNLNGLSMVTSIGGYLWIEGYNPLYNLTGLDNLTSIGSHLFIYNTALIFLTGLENVTSIGGGLYIGDQYVGGNPDLNNFTGLNNLTSIGGDLYIGWNGGLTSLTGLDNVDAGSISNLTIKNNVSLATCDVQSICDYLKSPNGNVYIGINAPGCNNQPEVEQHCLTTVEEIKTGNGITIIPNPSHDKITISSPTLIGITQLSIFNVDGEKVKERQLTNTETQLDISALPRGIYFVRLQNEKMVEVEKVVKE